MPLSSKSRDIVISEYAQLSGKLARKCRNDVARLRETRQRGGGLIKAVDDRHIANMEELYEALCDMYIAAFDREDAQMTLQDVSEITAEISRDVEAVLQMRAELDARSVGLDFHENLRRLVPRMRQKLVIAMKRLELERELASRTPEQWRAVVEQRTIYNISGPNARVNINSNDTSVNVVSIGPQQLFADLRSAIEREIEPHETRDDLLRKVSELESSAGTPSYLTYYQQFISALADHVGVLQAFLPALTQLIR